MPKEPKKKNTLFLEFYIKTGLYSKPRAWQSKFKCCVEVREPNLS